MIDNIETFVTSHFSDSDFYDKYRKFIKDNYPNQITEPILGDDHLTELTNHIILGDKLARDAFDYLKADNVIIEDDDLSHELISLARDIPTFSIDELREVMDKYRNITSVNPEYEELYIEVFGPSADEVVNTLCDEGRPGDLDKLTQDVYPRAFSELYDDNWYMRLRPETVVRLMAERSMEAPDFSGYGKLEGAKKVADDVLGVVTGNRVTNTINKVKSDIHNTIDRYNPGASEGPTLKPQGASGGDYSEKKKESNPTSEVIQKLRERGLENKPPIGDPTSKSIPTGDKPDEHLGGNPNDKSEGNTDMAIQKEVMMQTEDPVTGEIKSVHTIVDPSAPALAVDRIIRRYVKEIPNTCSSRDMSQIIDHILYKSACDFSKKKNGFLKNLDDNLKKSGEALDKAGKGEYGKTYEMAAGSLNNMLGAYRRNTRNKLAKQRAIDAINPFTSFGKWRLKVDERKEKEASGDNGDDKNKDNKEGESTPAPEVSTPAVNPDTPNGSVGLTGDKKTDINNVYKDAQAMVAQPPENKDNKGSENNSENKTEGNKTNSLPSLPELSKKELHKNQKALKHAPDAVKGPDGKYNLDFEHKNLDMSFENII